MDLINATCQTIVMVAISLVGAYVFGIPLGVILVGTRKEGIFPNRFWNAILGWIVNTIRSIPFIILLVALIPVTRFLLGTGIGMAAVILPLIVACVPFVARMVETSLLEIDKGMIDAAVAMGASKLQIFFNIYLPESIPSLVRGAAITCIALIGYTAMAGMVDGGGLGQYAIYKGYYQYQYDQVIYTVIILVVLVEIIQLGFISLAKRLDKKRGNIK
ncbi:MAG: methionine ABC transporter permease [Bacilli bacterium]|nr:ABC transporter permease [Bacilli bacterium]MDD3422144.1 ABC transporter permease [Bacilli bacterium]MDD4065538.1 ABC transporter permease [Bacilli bacterium]